MTLLLRSVFGAYAEIFFLRGVVPGVLLFLLTLANPGSAATGMAALIAAYACGRLLYMPREQLLAGHCIYNVLFTGSSLGFLCKLTPELLLLAALAGVLTLFITIALVHVFSLYLKLPVFSIPFVFSAWIVWLVAHHAPTFAAEKLALPLTCLPEIELPYYCAGFFKSFGTLLFAPSTTAGLAISVIVLASSRILFMLAVAGYYCGVAFNTVILDSSFRAFDDHNGFNFILVAMSVGGVFLVPSLRSYAVALLAVGVSVLFLDAASSAGQPYDLPPFTLPFAVAALLAVYVARLLHFPLVPYHIGATPEETLQNFATNAVRFPAHPSAARAVFLPFSGAWTVWQAFDGDWTHKGHWRYAYDFVIKDEQGATHSSDGTELSQYHCFQKPVLSPVRGRVATVIDHLPDNVPGTVDRADNWGNLVVLWDERGFYIELSHLAFNSIRVKVGDWVERGAVLGACGNSGHSPQPHLHIQCQLTAALGAPTIPFSFAGFTDGKEYFSHGLPALNQQAEALMPDRGMELWSALVLDQVFEFDILRHGAPAGRSRMVVKMDADGSYYLSSHDARLYFGKIDGTFYFYRLDGYDACLALLFSALPRLPLSQRDGMIWKDFLPAGIALRSWRRHVAAFVSPFYHRIARVETEHTFVSRYQVRTSIVSRYLKVKHNAEVELHPQQGICSVRMNGLELRRVQV